MVVYVLAGVVAFQSAALLLLLHQTVRWVWAHETSRDNERGRVADERRELLNRIQRPDIVPVHPASGYQVPEPEMDDIELVGTIAYDPEVTD